MKLCTGFTSIGTTWNRKTVCLFQLAICSMHGQSRDGQYVQATLLVMILKPSLNSHTAVISNKRYPGVNRVSGDVYLQLTCYSFFRTNVNQLLPTNVHHNSSAQLTINTALGSSQNRDCCEVLVCQQTWHCLKCRVRHSGGAVCNFCMQQPNSAAANLQFLTSFSFTNLHCESSTRLIPCTCTPPVHNLPPQCRCARLFSLFSSLSLSVTLSLSLSLCVTLSLSLSHTHTHIQS